MELVQHPSTFPHIQFHERYARSSTGMEAKALELVQAVEHHFNIDTHLMSGVL
jgi:hypothetical protein